MAGSVPIDNSYALPTGLGFAGQYPGDLTESVTRQKIRAILNAGVTSFIDLTEPGEDARGTPLRAYEHLLREEAAQHGVDVEYVRLSVPDQRIPHAKSRMKEILDALDDAERRGRRVYLHCWGGKGRTGTAVACHLVRRGHSAADALKQVQQLAHTMPRGKGVRVPENDMQCRFVNECLATD